MKPKIINNCKKTYRFNAEQLTERIIHGIPEKYLDGLGEVLLFDSGKEQNSINRYIPANTKLKRARIEIDLSSTIFRIPYCSTLSLNIFLLLSINQHISKYLKNRTEDQEILSFNTNRVNYDWINFGIWSPIAVLNSAFHYCVGKREVFQKMLKWWSNIVTRETNSKNRRVDKGSS